MDSNRQVTDVSHWHYKLFFCFLNRAIESFSAAIQPATGCCCCCQKLINFKVAQKRWPPLSAHLKKKNTECVSSYSETHYDKLGKRTTVVGLEELDSGSSLFFFHCKSGHNQLGPHNVSCTLESRQVCLGFVPVKDLGLCGPCGWSVMSCENHNNMSGVTEAQHGVTPLWGRIWERNHNKLYIFLSTDDFLENNIHSFLMQSQYDISNMKHWY